MHGRAFAFAHSHTTHAFSSPIWGVNMQTLFLIMNAVVHYDSTSVKCMVALSPSRCSHGFRAALLVCLLVVALSLVMRVSGLGLSLLRSRPFPRPSFLFLSSFVPVVIPLPWLLSCLLSNICVPTAIFPPRS